MAIVKSVASAKQSGNMLENLPGFEDFEPLLSDKARAVVSSKRAELEKAGALAMKMERRADVLKKEILRLAGEQMSELRGIQKALSTGRKNITIRMADIWSIIQYDTAEIPGTDEYEKKEFMIKQQSGQAKELR